MRKKFLPAIALMFMPVFLPALAQAADITGVPKIREGDSIQIGSTRIRLGGIDAPSVVAPGMAASMTVTITNKGAGHDLPAKRRRRACP